MSTVNISCSLPSGLRLQVPGSPDVVLAGSNSTTPRPNPHGAPWGQNTTPAPGITAVDADFWAAWLAINSGLPMVVNGCVAVAS